MYHCWPLYCKLFTCRLIIVFPIFICRLMIPHAIEFDGKTGLKLPAAASPLSSLDLASVLCCTWQQPATTQSSAAPRLHQNNTNPITLWWHREGHLLAARLDAVALGPMGTAACGWPGGGDLHQLRLCRKPLSSLLLNPIAVREQICSFPPRHLFLLSRN